MRGLDIRYEFLRRRQRDLDVPSAALLIGFSRDTKRHCLHGLETGYY